MKYHQQIEIVPEGQGQISTTFGLPCHHFGIPSFSHTSCVLAKTVLPRLFLSLKLHLI